MLPELQTFRTCLKPLNFSHAPQIFDLRSNTEVMRYMDSESCRNLEDAEMFICRQIEANKENEGANWGIFLRDSAQLIGYAGFWRINKEHFRGEFGYALHPDFWRTGLMLEVLNDIACYGFKNLGLHSIEANINPKNSASAGLLLKLGFKLEAQFSENFYFNGIFHDSHIYSLLEKNFIQSCINEKSET
ncbi:GNAT family N-acetyltransferase [Daejeonella oryzae]|uniref:GNAT family N-acetyltransferase n=1 Tax=Daejeonella oryzae TaxID=1122943 RepID=UPI000417B2A4|nr:GNAT family N-acetyltransferase [Daejeonella oryzae]